jgi:hypothetical protein
MPSTSTLNKIRERLRSDPKIAKEAIGQAARILRDQRPDIVRCKRIAADIIGIASESSIDNVSLTIAVRAAIDMVIFGAAAPRVVSSARTLWTRLLIADGARTSLLFRTALQNAVATSPKGAMQRALVVLEQWQDMATQRAQPFANVDWTSLIAKLESVRDVELPASSAQEGTVTWRRVRARTNAVVPATLQCMMWNGNGFMSRWEAGDIAAVVSRHDPYVLIFHETKTSPACMPSPWTIRETMFAMGFCSVVWHSSTVNPRHHGVMVASKWPLPLEFGLDHEAIDREGLAIIIHHPCKTEAHAPRGDFFKSA